MQFARSLMRSCCPKKFFKIVFGGMYWVFWEFESYLMIFSEWWISTSWYFLSDGLVHHDIFWMLDYYIMIFSECWIVPHDIFWVLDQYLMIFSECCLLKGTLKILNRMTAVGCCDMWRKLPSNWNILNIKRMHSFSIWCIISTFIHIQTVTFSKTMFF